MFIFNTWYSAKKWTLINASGALCVLVATKKYKCIEFFKIRGQWFWSESPLRIEQGK